MSRTLEPNVLDLIRQGAALCKDLERLHEIDRPLSRAEAAKAEALPGEISQVAEKALVETHRQSPSEIVNAARELALSGNANASGFALFAEAIARAAGAEDRAA